MTVRPGTDAPMRRTSSAPTPIPTWRGQDRRAGGSTPPPRATGRFERHARRRLGDRDRQPPRRPGHPHGHVDQRQGSRRRCARGRRPGRPGLHPDRCRDQPRQLRRSAHQRARRGGRHQLGGEPDRTGPRFLHPHQSRPQGGHRTHPHRHGAPRVSRDPPAADHRRSARGMGDARPGRHPGREASRRRRPPSGAAFSSGT